MKIFLLIFVVCSVKAQNSIQLQFLGDSLSIEEATNRELCDTKYCLSDAKYLFYGATQNKSVRPCDDFKEFALGNFVKYESVNDRLPYVGFFSDYQLNYYQKVRRVLAEPVNGNDSRLSKGMKTFFAKCVNSKYVRKNGMREAREHARSLGLKFYPETNDKDFNLKDYAENPVKSNFLSRLFNINVVYFDSSSPTNLSVKYYLDNDYFKLQLEGYANMLVEMNQIYRNFSYSEEFKKEFEEIGNKQIQFKKRLENIISSINEENSTKLMTIEELNNLTLPLNLNWLTIINNQLFKKINSSKQIFVERPQTFAKIAEYLAETDKDAIADYLVYDLLYQEIDGILLYVHDKLRITRVSSKRTIERWSLCLNILQTEMFPALDALYLKRYFNKESEASLRKLANETMEFAVKKFKSINQWGEELFEGLSGDMKTIKFVFGYSEEIVGAEMLEELYGSLDFNQTFIKVYHQIIALHAKLKRDITARELLALESRQIFKFTYRLSDNIIFIDSIFLNYPFYDKDRPRFFNTATVSGLILESVFYNIQLFILVQIKSSGFNRFDDNLQYGYEFYESWLESGGEELNLGANRLTNRQLYWVAAARTYFRKYQSGFKIPEPLDYLNDIHKFFFAKPGFKEAFDCKIEDKM